MPASVLSGDVSAPSDGGSTQVQAGPLSRGAEVAEFLPSPFDHAVDGAVAAIRVVMKEEEMLQETLPRDLYSLLPEAVPPSFLFPC